MSKKLADFKQIDFVYNYLNMINETKSSQTFSNYARDLGKFVTYFKIQSPTDIENISREQFSNFVFSLKATLNTNSINGVIRNISPFLVYLLDNEIIKSEKISSTKFGKGRYLNFVKKVPFALTNDEIEKISSKMNAQSRIMFTFMLNTGCRAGEICNLKMSDISEDGSIVINGKGSKQRTLAMSDGLRQIMEVWFTLRDKNNEYIFYPTSGEMNIEKKLKREAVNERIKTAVSKTDISAERKSRITAHKTRSTLITRVIEQHGIERARQVAGHSNIATTEAYNASNLASSTLRDMNFVGKSTVTVKMFCEYTGKKLSECDCEVCKK